jgi:hypothetical protein
MVLFRGEIVETGVDFQRQGVKRRRGTIVRMVMEIGRDGRLCPPGARAKKGCGDPLAGPDEKVTSLEVGPGAHLSLLSHVSNGKPLQ